MVTTEELDRARVAWLEAQEAATTARTLATLQTAVARAADYVRLSGSRLTLPPADELATWVAWSFVEVRGVLAVLEEAPKSADGPGLGFWTVLTWMRRGLDVMREAARAVSGDRWAEVDSAAAVVWCVAFGGQLPTPARQVLAQVAATMAAEDEEDDDGDDW